MEESKDIDKEEFTGANAEVVVFDHIKIVELETNKEIINKRG